MSTPALWVNEPIIIRDAKLELLPPAAPVFQMQFLIN